MRTLPQISFERRDYPLKTLKVAKLSKSALAKRCFWILGRAGCCGRTKGKPLTDTQVRKLTGLRQTEIDIAAEEA